MNDQLSYQQCSQSAIQHDVIMATLVEKQEYNLFSMLKPKLSKDGNMWCCLYGEDLQTGIVGFGQTPHKAIIAFNQSFHKN